MHQVHFTPPKISQFPIVKLQKSEQQSGIAIRATFVLVPIREDQHESKSVTRYTNSKSEPVVVWLDLVRPERSV